MTTETKPKRRIFASTPTMLAAAATGIVTPIATQAPTARANTPTVQQPASPNSNQQMNARQATTQNGIQSLGLLDGLGGMTRSYRPFAPWAAPLYNQRKTRRRARQQGSRVRH